MNSSFKRRYVSLSSSNLPKRLKSESDQSSSEVEFDGDDDGEISTDQQNYRPVLSVPFAFNSHTERLIEEFHQLNRRTRRKTLQFVPSMENDEKSVYVLKSSSNRSEGFVVFSSTSFPFHSLCYLCGSVGHDLIYCHRCAQAYHNYCLKTEERPCFRPRSDFWTCPNCSFCQICGLNCSTSSIRCFDCQRRFHRKCLKAEENLESYASSSSRWLCPRCLKCDCGQTIRSTEENLLPSGKSFATQQSLMCDDCAKNFKDLRTKSNIKLEKCRFCQRYLSQYLTKTKPLFSLSLISQQIKAKEVPLFQCHRCEHYFHPQCDGFHREDVHFRSSIPMKIVCSQCNREEKESIDKSFRNEKIELCKNLRRDLESICLQFLPNVDRFRCFQFDEFPPSFSVETFLNDLLQFIDEFLSSLPKSQWEMPIERCFTRHCPWFRFPTLFKANSIRTPSPIDHSYASKENPKNEENSSWNNFHRIDTRRCVFCETSPLDRLVPIGINQWIHLTCLLPLYAKSTHLSSSSTSLTELQQNIELCQTKFFCDLCSKNGASISCLVKNCSARFHRSCLEQFYSTHAAHPQMNKGLLPNLMTLCSKHHDVSSSDAFLPPSPSIHLDLSNTSLQIDFNELRLAIGSLQISSLGHFDSSESLYPADYRASRVFWSTNNARQLTVYHLHIEIEQIYHQQSFNHRTWSNPPSDEDLQLHRLYDECENYFRKFQKQTAPTTSSTPSSDPIAEILSIDTKTLRTLFTSEAMKSSHLSRFAFALVQALQQIDQTSPTIKSEPQTPIFSYYPIPQLDGSIDRSPLTAEDLIERYFQWTKSQIGRVKFLINSDDGLTIESEDLDQAWSTILHQVRSSRDEMKLTHLPLDEDDLNGHQIFGLNKSIVKQLFQRMNQQDQSSNNVLFLSAPTSSRSCSKKKLRRSTKFHSSRSLIYQRKHQRRQPFAWLLNPHRDLQSALDSFEIDETLAFVRQILLQEASVTLRLYLLSYFSDRVLFVGRSTIHGCGLFTLIDLVEGQMIIEYLGDVIRQSLTDQRERENERKGLGCYMFTVDSINVIDATRQGNQARFINHHCQPNCLAKTVQCAGGKHIVIYAAMDIPRGSELTYDYSFQEEEIKIPCHCGTSDCRMYLN